MVLYPYLILESMADETSSNETFLNPSRRSYVYETSKSSGNKNRVILIVIGIIILIGLVAFAVIATGGKGEGDKLTPTPTVISTTPTSVPTETPTPTPGKGTPTVTPTKGTPTPTGKTTLTPKVSPTGTTTNLDRANLKVAVLNGSGVVGAAAKASDALKKLGYDVVSTGNADTSDYTSTTIQVTSTKKAYLDLLKSDLSSTYTIGTATADYTGTTTDAVVIVGKE